MKNLMLRLNSVHCMVLVSLCLGGVYLIFALGTSILVPTDISWLMTETDWSTHFLGWHLFRNEAWQFPLGRLASIEHPVGASIGYSDSIPLLAVLFKLFHSVLPDDFQYFGLWLLVCFSLQGLFGALLTRTMSDNLAVQLLGAAFFIVSPILLARVGHPALCCHWLLLAALWLYMKRWSPSSTSGYLRTWLIITVFAATIHPYITCMILGLAFAFYLRVLLVDHRIGSKAVFLHLGALVSAALAIWWALGYFELGRLGNSYGSFGYGYFSLNLASPINPIGWSEAMWSGGSWSIFLREWPASTKGQADGFNYMGIGAIILGVWACYVFMERPVKPRTAKRLLPLLLVCTCFALFALSHKITLSNHTLLELELNRYLKGALSPFRSSGRFFWPVHYCLLFLILALLIRRNSAKKAILVLSIGLALQLVDFQNAYRAYTELRHSKNEWQNPLQSDLWNEIGKNYKRILFVPPPEALGRKALTYYAPFAYLAARHKMSLNAFYLARHDYDASREYRDKLISDVVAGVVDPTSVYILDQEYLMLLQDVHETPLSCSTIDGFNVCTSGRHLTDP